MLAWEKLKKTILRSSSRGKRDWVSHDIRPKQGYIVPDVANEVAYTGSIIIAVLTTILICYSESQKNPDPEGKDCAIAHNLSLFKLYIVCLVPWLLTCFWVFGHKWIIRKELRKRRRKLIDPVQRKLSDLFSTPKEMMDNKPMSKEKMEATPKKERKAILSMEWIAISKRKAMKKRKRKQFKKIKVEARRKFLKELQNKERTAAMIEEISICLAGCTVMLWCCGSDYECSSVTIERKWNCEGRLLFNIIESPCIENILFEELCTCLARPISEELFMENIEHNFTPGEDAFRYVLPLCNMFLFREIGYDNFNPLETSVTIEDLVAFFIRKSHQAVVRHLIRYQTMIIKLATELVKRKTLQKDEIDFILGPPPPYGISLFEEYCIPDCNKPPDEIIRLLPVVKLNNEEKNFLKRELVDEIQKHLKQAEIQKHLKKAKKQNHLKKSENQKHLKKAKSKKKK